MLMPYRTTLGTSAVTFGVHDSTTGTQTAAPVAAAAGAVTDSLRFFTSSDITGPAIVRWYEDAVQVADEYVPPDTQASATAALTAQGLIPARAAKLDLLPDTVVASKVDVDAAKAAIDGNGGDLTLPYRILLDSNGDGVADDPPVGIPGIKCILTSDLGGAVRIGSVRYTDSQGWAYWRGLVAGTYYVWRDDPRFTGANPDTEVVS